MKFGLLLAVVGLAVLPGCRPGQGATAPLPITAMAGPAAAYAAFEAGEPLPVGRIVGRVLRLERGAFRPAPEVAVRLDEASAAARTEADGSYGFDHVPAGVHRVGVAAPGSLPMAVAFRAGTVGGLGRLNLLLVPERDEVASDDTAITLAGIAVDPRGAALPGATVRVADSLTRAGNAMTKASAEGAWAIVLPGARRARLVSGIASLTCHGRTPGGLAVEAMEVTTLALGGEPTASIVAATRAFAVPSGLTWEATGEGRGRIRGQGLPTRRDEVALRVAVGAGTVEWAPSQAAGDGVSVELPSGVGAPRRLEVLPLGLVPPSGEAPTLMVP